MAAKKQPTAMHMSGRCTHRVNGICKFCDQASRQEWDGVLRKMGEINSLLDVKEPVNSLEVDGGQSSIDVDAYEASDITIACDSL